MINKKIQNYCSFVSVCDYLLAMLFASVTAFFIVVCFSFEMLILIPARTWIFVFCLLGMLVIAACVGCTVLSLYGAAILWDPRAESRKRYVIGQVISAVFMVAGIVTGIILNVLGLMGIVLSAVYYTFLIGLSTVNIIAFGVKPREELQKESKADISRNDKTKSRDKKKDKKEKKTEHRKAGILAERGQYAGSVFWLKPNEIIIFGTDSKECQVLFKDHHISRKHCIVCYRAEEDVYEIMDCSQNGTFWTNRERLTYSEKYKCKAGKAFVVCREEKFRFL